MDWSGDNVTILVYSVRFWVWLFFKSELMLRDLGVLENVNNIPRDFEAGYFLKPTLILRDSGLWRSGDNVSI